MSSQDKRKGTELTRLVERLRWMRRQLMRCVRSGYGNGDMARSINAAIVRLRAKIKDEQKDA